jgi:hypothetical protein
MISSTPPPPSHSPPRMVNSRVVDRSRHSVSKGILESKGEGVTKAENRDVSE